MNNKKELWNIVIGLAGMMILMLVFRLQFTFTHLLLTFLAAYPWRFGKTIVSLFGGINPHGSVYSLAGLISIAEKHSFSLVGIMPYQQAKNGNALTVLGLVLYQKARNYACLGFGAAWCQDSHKKSTVAGIGFVISQNACENAFLAIGFVFVQQAVDYALLLFGLTFEQEAKKENANIFAGVALIQQGGNGAFMGFGFCAIQCACKNTLLAIGLSFYQEAKDVDAGIGIIICQNGQKEAEFLVGIVGIQKGTSRYAKLLIGFAGYQKSEKDVSIWFGIRGYQKIEKVEEEKSELVEASGE